MSAKHNIIVANLAAHTAERLAAVGPVEHPDQLIHDLLGHRVYHGQKMLDAVTGQIVEVQYAGVTEVTHHQTPAE